MLLKVWVTKIQQKTIKLSVLDPKKSREKLGAETSKILAQLATTYLAEQELSALTSVKIIK